MSSIESGNSEQNKSQEIWSDDQWKITIEFPRMENAPYQRIVTLWKKWKTASHEGASVEYTIFVPNYRKVDFAILAGRIQQLLLTRKDVLDAFKQVEGELDTHHMLYRL